MYNDPVLIDVLTHWGRVTHTVYASVNHPSSVQIIWSAPRSYLNQYWNIVNFNIKNKLQWNLQQNSYIFIKENAFENVVCRMVVILFRSQCIIPFDPDNGIFMSVGVCWFLIQQSQQQPWYCLCRDWCTVKMDFKFRSRPISTNHTNCYTLSIYYRSSLHTKCLSLFLQKIPLHVDEFKIRKKLSLKH